MKTIMVRNWVVLMAIIVITLCKPLSAQTTTTRQYLHLGADPQNSGFQCNTSIGEVVLPDKDVFDSGWGSGHGKVAGWYPAYTAMCRKKSDHTVIAVMGCGNVPSGQDVVEGKVIEVATPPPSTTPPPATSSSSTPPAPISFSPVFNNNYYGRGQQESVNQPLAPPFTATAPPNHHWGIWATVIGGVTAITVAIIVTRDHNSSPVSGGTVNTGGAQ